MTVTATAVPRRVVVLAFLVTLLLAVTSCERQRPALDAEELATLWRLRNLGRAHFDNGETGQAITSLTECVRMAPGSAADHVNLAIALIRGRRLDDARVQLHTALEIDAGATAPHYLLGIAAAREGDDAVARAEFERVVAAGAADAATWYHLARACQILDDAPAAEEALREAIRLDPEHLSARYQLFLVLRRRGALNAARQEMEIVKRLRRSIPEFRRTAEALESSVHTQLVVPPRVAAATAPPAAAPGTPPPRAAAPPPLVFADSTAAWLPRGAMQPCSDGAVLPLGESDRPGLVLFGAQGGVVLENDGSGHLAPRAAPAVAAVRVAVDGAGRHPTTARAAGSRRVVAGDFDHDGRPDLCVLGTAAPVLLVSAEGGGFADATPGSGLEGIGAGAAPAAVDVDRDGDLDLLAWTDSGRLVLYQNEGKPEAESPLRFHLAAAGIDASLAAPPAQIIWTDLANDGAPDFLVLDAAGRSYLYFNRKLGRFAEKAGALGWVAVRGRAVAPGDVDADLREDLLVVGPDGWHLFHAAADGTLEPRDDWLPQWPAGGWTPRDVVLADLDNDGDLDAAVAGAPPPGAPGAAAMSPPLLLLRNTGGRFQLERGGLGPAWPAARPRAIERLLAADLDRDGRLDLCLLAADGPPLLLRNTGPVAGRLLEVRLHGARAAGCGTGTIIEAQAGPESVRRVVREPLSAIGVGAHPQLDLLRLLWVNGAIQSLTEVPVEPGARPLRIEEKQEVAGSCPVLYAWDGARYRMATDLLGTSPLGFPMGGGAYLEPQGEELVKIPESVRLVPRDGRYLLAIAEEMREVVYLDQVRLIAVDHPDSLAVFSNYVFREPPWDPPALVVLHRLRVPRRATDQDGRDVTALVARADRRYPHGFTPLAQPFQGLATPQALVLDFGELGDYRAPVLILTGWTDWTDGPAEAAVAQHRALEVELPVLEVPDGAGGWRPAAPWFGIPSLKLKDIMLDLRGRLAAGDQRLRLRTNLRAYWDRLLVGERIGDAERAQLVRVQRLAPLAATLVEKGMSAQHSPDGRLPLVYDHDAIRPHPVWRTHTGLATRHGDVLELVAEADDRMAIFTLGDAVRLEFDARALPPLPPGWRRSFLVETHGWEKEGDAYTALSTSVGPLPYRGMPGDPAAAGAVAGGRAGAAAGSGYPLDAGTLRYLFEYNTRVIGAQRLAPGAVTRTSATARP